VAEVGGHDATELALGGDVALDAVDLADAPAGVSIRGNAPVDALADQLAVLR
jgi:hypothetical protein